MNKGMFSGWRDVFSFSLKQATGKSSETQHWGRPW